MGDLEDSSPLSATAGSKRWRLTRLRSGGRWPEASRFIVVLLILYAVKQIFSVASYYPFSGHDELAHFSYVRTLASEGRLPQLPELRTWRAGLNGGDPPPTDEIPAELYPFCRFALDWYCDPHSPRWGANPPRIVTVPGMGYFPSGYQYAANHPPLYYATMAPLYAASSAASPLVQQYLLRLAAIPFGLLTVYAAYRATRSLFPGDAFLTVTVPAFVAFQPQISYEAAMVNNDIVAIALTSLILWGLVAGMKERFPLRLCAAARGRTRSRPAVQGHGNNGGADHRGRGHSRRRLARLARTPRPGRRNRYPGDPSPAPWYLFLYRTYGDFSGLSRLKELQYWNSPMGSFFELLVDPDFILNRFRETWGEFGWRQIHLRDGLLWAIGIATILALVGLAFMRCRCGDARRACAMTRSCVRGPGREMG